MTTAFRKFGRSPLPGRVKLEHSELGELFAEDGDISATGLFVKISESGAMAVGDVLRVEVPHAASEVYSKARLRVVRVTNEGVGLTFL